MKRREAEQKWWQELSGWMERHEGRADYLFVYDPKRGRLERCFDRNAALGAVDEATVSCLYQAAIDSRLGMLRPKDLKPQLLGVVPEKLFISGVELSMAAQQSGMQEHSEAAETGEREAIAAEQRPELAPQPTAVAQQVTAPKPTGVARQTEAKQQPTVAAQEGERTALAAEPNAAPQKEREHEKTEAELTLKLDERKLMRAAADAVLTKQLRMAEAQYRAAVYTLGQRERPAGTEKSGDASAARKRRMKLAAAAEQAVEMVRRAMDLQPEEEIGTQQQQLAASLAQMMLGMEDWETLEEERRERERRIKAGLIAAQNLFIWAAVNEKREQEAADMWLELMKQTERMMMWTLTEQVWTERLEDMAQELHELDLAGISESECNDKIRDYLDGKSPTHERKESNGEKGEEPAVSGELWGNALRHFCRFAASEVPLSIRHVQVAVQCRKIMEQVKELGLSFETLGLDPQEQMAVQGTMEMGALVERGLLAQAALSGPHRLNQKQFRQCLQSYLAMKGMEETLIPHVQAHQQEISTGDGPVSALQILMANRGFRADELKMKAGRTAAMLRLERLGQQQVGQMIREGSGELAAMGRQVMIASCQMGEVAEPAHEHRAAQKGGPLR